MRLHDRRRLVEAMGIGPLWVARSANRPLAGVGDTREADIATLDWPDLVSAAQACTACPLCTGRTGVVLGDGPESPDWLIVGSGPDADEDRTGRLFPGKAGRLLDGMLAAAGHGRGRDSFVSVAVKCRISDDHGPTAAEITLCRPWLLRQIALLAPRGVLALGDVAAAALLGADTSVASARGRVHRFDGDLPLVVTHHPAGLLVDPIKKSETWADLCLAENATAGQR